MIKTDNLFEFSSLMALKSYCSHHYECSDCIVREMCRCMTVCPSELVIIYEEDKSREKQ